MLGGLIAGALGGGAQAVSGLADQVIKEAQAAKERAYKEGLLKWELDEKRKDAETQREFQMGMATFESQNADARLTKEIDFKTSEGDKDRKSRKEAAAIGNAPKPLTKEQIRISTLTDQRDAAIDAGDAAALAKANLKLGIKENDAGKYEIKERKDMTGASLGYDLVSPNGYRPIPMIGAPTVSAQSTNPQSKVPWANTYAK